MKVTLIIAPWEFGGEEISRLYPIGLASLGAVLEKEGHDVKVLNIGDKSWNIEKERIRKFILKESPDIVGLSILTSNRNSSFDLLKLVKKINSRIITIGGGVHATLMYEQVLKNYRQLDFVVRGEAEHTLVELVNAIKNKASFDQFKNIKGLAFRHDNQIVLTPCRERIKDLNSLPMPKHEYFEDQIQKYGIAYVMTSRGCPFNCGFCPSAPLWNRLVVRRSAENIFAEIKHLIDRFPNLKCIAFADDEFIVDNQRIIDLCKLMITNNVKIPWYCSGRVTSVNENLMKWMKKAGCTKIMFGVESGSQEILDKMNKRQTVSQIIRAFDICKKCGLKAEPLLIIGFPGENSKTVNDTIKLLKRVKCVGDPGFLFLVPGTEVYELAKKQKYISDDYWLTNKPIPFYFKEHSRLKLTYWNLKVFFYSHLYSKNGLKLFIKHKFLDKLNFFHLKAMLKRYTKA